MLEIIGRLALMIVVVYALFGLFLYLFQSSMIYHPDNTDFYECDYFFEGEFKEHNGTRFYYQEESEDVVVLYHGNAGRACDRASMISFLPEGYSYALVEYTGYAGDGESPSKEAILRDAGNMAEFFEGKRVHLFGESIGSSAAAYHSSNSDSVRSITMIAPFYSLEDYASSRYFMYPVTLLLRENYDTASYLEGYNNRSLIVHGDNDFVVPLNQSEKLYNSLQGYKERVIIEGAGHNNIYGFSEAQDTIRNFIANS